MQSDPPPSSSNSQSSLARLCPPGWRLPILIGLGTLFGLSIVLLRVSNATSYLSDDPKACVNCHIMTPQFATWERGSHARVASCNDCHVPHDTLLNKYYFKAKDGARHAFMFTFHMEPQVIKVHEPGMAVIQDNCIRCHEHLLDEGVHLAVSLQEAETGTGKLCWDCHRETPHGKVNSLSSTQWARTPTLDPVMPEWMNKQLSKQNESENEPAE
ncbi:cytochrome c nitrite reductase small subunit [Pelagicoccus mobilis]|uniref:Cytochrome c nitrite reductase small subunit n=1 Tax=Pelagicoccus mobilis TaxID=415221 RepID=A0A934RUJ9_9BACT|nr:cytochrome c nitrite reductase small subunit [Pelagicoccus mobilis]MBK1876688.1 cytochrome c nitrite reductase small subunit [Pelagicoccus mobilis]